MDLWFDPEKVPARFLPRNMGLEAFIEQAAEESGESAESIVKLLEMQWRVTYAEDRMLKAAIAHQLMLMREESEDLEEDASYLQARGTTVELWNAARMWVRALDSVIADSLTQTDPEARDWARDFGDAFVDNSKFPWE